MRTFVSFTTLAFLLVSCSVTPLSVDDLSHILGGGGSFIKPIERVSSWVISSPVPVATRNSRDYVLKRSDGVLYLAFREGSTAYIYRQNGASFTQAASIPSVDTLISIEIFQGVLYVSYEDSEKNIRIRKWERSTWTDATELSTLLWTAHVKAHNGQLYIAYIDISSFARLIRYTGTGRVWTEIGTPSPERVRPPSFSTIALAFQQDQPYMAAARNSTFKPVIFRLSGGAWTASVAPASVPSINSSYTLHVDSQGVLYINYLSGIVPNVGDFHMLTFRNNAFTSHFKNPTYGQTTALYNDQLFTTFGRVDPHPDLGDAAQSPGPLSFSRITGSPLSMLPFPENTFPNGQNVGQFPALLIDEGKIYILYLHGSRQLQVASAAFQ